MKDLTSLKTYIIDSENPHEVDDAFSLEIKKGNKKKLWIHISNPCKLFMHDSYVDIDARRKNNSFNSKIVLKLSKCYSTDQDQREIK